MMGFHYLAVVQVFSRITEELLEVYLVLSVKYRNFVKHQHGCSLFQELDCNIPLLLLVIEHRIQNVELKKVTCVKTLL